MCALAGGLKRGGRQPEMYRKLVKAIDLEINEEFGGGAS